MSQRPQELVIESTNVVELVGLRDETTAEWIDDATVTVTIYDDAAVAVTDAEDITMDHVAGTTGAKTKYRGAIPSTVVFIAGAQYTAKVVATKGSSVRTFPIPSTAVLLP